MSVVVEAENLSKKFFRGERNQRAFFEDIAHRTLLGMRRLTGKAQASEQRTWFWALRDVSFQIRKGETLAIVGDNGAGKSTLLKILSRITKPTTGTVRVYGRLASLLEFGTGFHPEFSGRDNVFLNGAMLGLSRREVRARFDQIVEFSGLEDFLEVPVKNYSSGMYMRLAFAVAAHMNPEIVILDEILSVGDAVFQKKCFDRMEEIIREGHAAILVSHALPYVEKMSQVCIWLERGRIRQIGRSNEVVSSYTLFTSERVSALRDQRERAEFIEVQTPAMIESWSVQSELTTDPHAAVPGGGPFIFSFILDLRQTVSNARVETILTDSNEIPLVIRSSDANDLWIGRHEITFRIAELPLRPGRYGLAVAIFSGDHSVAKLHASPDLAILPTESMGSNDIRALLQVPSELSVRPVESNAPVVA